MKICVKDLNGLGSSHDPLIASYAVTGGCLLILLLLWLLFLELLLFVIIIIIIIIITITMTYYCILLRIIITEFTRYYSFGP